VDFALPGEESGRRMARTDVNFIVPSSRVKVDSLPSRNKKGPHVLRFDIVPKGVFPQADDKGNVVSL